MPGGVHTQTTPTMFAEPSVIPGTVLHLQGLSIHMQVLAVTIVTLSKLLEEVAWWHLGHVILMKELAIISLLAQVSQPVLAHCALTSTGMAVRAVSSTNTTTNYKLLTKWSLIL